MRATKFRSTRIITIVDNRIVGITRKLYYI